MSLKSLPIPNNFDRGNAGEALSDAGVGKLVQLRSLKMPNKRGDFEGERAERARIMFKSRAANIGTLTRLQANIEELMQNSGTLEDLRSKRKTYDEVCRKFVRVHEEYIECLELLCCEEELEKACISYEERKARKLDVYTVIESWYGQLKAESMERGEDAFSLSRKSTRSEGRK